MRCFLALIPDDRGRERLETLVRPLRQWELPARWQHTEDYHLTLCFLGQHNDASDVAGIRWAVDEVASSLLCPALSLSGLGAFGGKTHPKVVFAGVDDAEQRCRDYHENLCEVLSIKAEREFRPHITLCRPQRGNERKPRDWAQMIEAFGHADWGPLTMTHLVLFESRQPAHGGPRYHPLQHWPLIPEVPVI